MADCPGIFHLAQTGDGALARLRVPGGQLRADQLKAVGKIAGTLGNGLIDLTNRANLQIRGLKMSDGSALVEALQEVQLLGKNPATDRYRNITATPLSATDPASMFDLHPAVEALDVLLSKAPWIDSLSAKFSYVFDSNEERGGALDMRAVPHDVAFFAETRNDYPFRVSLAGELTEICVSKTDAAELGFRLASIAANSPAAKGRLRPLVEQNGHQWILRQAVGQDRLAIANRPLTTPLNSAKRNFPLPGPRPARDPNRLSFGLGVPHQRLTPESCDALSAACEKYGDAMLHLSPWFMVFLTNVEKRHLNALRAEVRGARFLTDPDEGALRIIACAGSSGCHRATMDTKIDGAQLAKSLSDNGQDKVKPFTIHLSGCIRGCAFTGRADLLLLADEACKGYTAYEKACTKDAAHQREYASHRTLSEIEPLAAELMRR